MLKLIKEITSGGFHIKISSSFFNNMRKCEIGNGYNLSWTFLIKDTADIKREWKKIQEELDLLFD